MKQSVFTLEPIRLEQDLDICLQFHQQAHGQRFSSQDDWQWLHQMATRYADGFRLICQDDVQIGLLEYSCSFELPNGHQGCYIWLMYLTPEFRNQGIGSAILELIEARSMQQQCTEMRLCCSRTNPDAIDFYQAHQWLLLSEENDLVVLQKLLKPEVVLQPAYSQTKSHGVLDAYRHS